jgi:hypothetical protein
MISVKAFMRLEARAHRAAEQGKLDEIAQINQHPELIAANMRFIVIDGRLYFGPRPLELEKLDTP